MGCKAVGQGSFRRATWLHLRWPQLTTQRTDRMGTWLVSDGLPNEITSFKKRRAADVTLILDFATK